MHRDRRSRLRTHRCFPGSALWGKPLGRASENEKTTQSEHHWGFFSLNVIIFFLWRLEPKSLDWLLGLSAICMSGPYAEMAARRSFNIIIITKCEPCLVLGFTRTGNSSTCPGLTSHMPSPADVTGRTARQQRPLGRRRESGRGTFFLGPREDSQS